MLIVQILQEIQIFDGLTNLFAAGKRGEVTEMTLQQTPRSWQPLVRKQFSNSEKYSQTCSSQEKSLTSWAKISTPWPQSVRCPSPPGNTLDLVGFEKIATSDALEYNWENMFILQNLFSKNHECTDFNFVHQRRSDVLQKYVSKNMNISNVRTRSRKTDVGFEEKNSTCLFWNCFEKYVNPLKSVHQRFMNHCQDKVTEGEE